MTLFAHGSEKTDGCDHHPYGFTVWLADGRIKGRAVHAPTDELGFSRNPGSTLRHHSAPDTLFRGSEKRMGEVMFIKPK